MGRFHTASAWATKRVSKEEVVIGEKSINEGEGVVAATQCGNRDEDVFQNPDVFDMKRVRGKAISLGYSWGEHRCVAEWLARAELEIVSGRPKSFLGNCRKIADKFGSDAVAKGTECETSDPFDQVKYSPSEKVAGVIELPILFRGRWESSPMLYPWTFLYSKEGLNEFLADSWDRWMMVTT
jgi:nitric oxide reductase